MRAPPGDRPATRWLVQFGYDGAGFSGWAKQPRLRTVEGEILDGLARSGMVRDPRSVHLSVASRTDKGVSARANALTLDSTLPGPALLRAMNGVCTDLFFRAASEVPPDFQARRATSRCYRYFELAQRRSPTRWRANAPLLTGRIDVRSFGRGLPADRPTWREVSEITVREVGRWMVVDIRAPSFVWGMVRKLVSTLRGLEDGELTEAQVRAATSGIRRVSVPLAEPGPLVLWEVEYPFPWQHRSRGSTPRQTRARDAARLDAEVRSEILSQLWERGEGPASRPDRPLRAPRAY